MYGHCDFQNPPQMASRKLLIARIAGAGTSFSSLQCRAWHGLRITNAHRVEAEVGTDGHASAPPSEAAVATSPAGAYMVSNISHEEVRVGADVPWSAPLPPGQPPARALSTNGTQNFEYFYAAKLKCR
jgi:hypothetical protein